MTDWTIDVRGPALRALDRLPAKVAWAVAQFIDGPLTRNPWRATKPLDEPLDGIRSGNVGVYRVLIVIDQEAATVTVVRVEHRSTVYSRPL